MSQSDVSGSHESTQPRGNQLPWQAQLAFAVVLTVVFIILVIIMLKSAKASSAQWQNLVYVFGSVEALVFTAIGWVFGREVQRSQVSSAQASEQQAKDEAKQNASKAEKASADAAAERSKVAELAVGVRIATLAPIAVAAGTNQAGGRARDVGLNDEPTTQAVGELSAPLAELRALADRLHPAD